MKTRLISSSVALLLAATSSSFAQGGQAPSGQGQPNVSVDEQNMAKAVMTAPDPVVQMKAASDFLKKYPKSTLRHRLAKELAQKIGNSTDPRSEERRVGKECRSRRAPEHSKKK